jgi:hypothetical protein
MTYFEQYITLRQNLWTNFEKLVRKGAAFPALLDVCYPIAKNPQGLSVNTEGRAWFYATHLLANSDYTLHEGDDLIVATHKVTFMDTNDNTHILEPDILDLYWLAELLDGAE